MKREYTAPLSVKCPQCGHQNVFNQPYAYHAGFGNQGFLYNETGTCTLIWSSFDPAYEALVGQKHPWVLGPKDQKALEEALRPSPDGTRWLFSNPARCTECGHSIGEPIGSNVHYLEYDGSVDLDPHGDPSRGFKDILTETVEQPSRHVPK